MKRLSAQQAAAEQAHAILLALRAAQERLAGAAPSTAIHAEYQNQRLPDGLEHVGHRAMLQYLASLAELGYVESEPRSHGRRGRKTYHQLNPARPIPTPTELRADHAEA